MKGVITWLKNTCCGLFSDRKKHSDQLVYDTVDLKTNHYCPFIGDEDFERAYITAMRLKIRDPSVDLSDHSFPVNLRHVGYVLSWAVSQVRTIPGDFIECGTHTASVARFVLELENLREMGRKWLLFDTFSGIPREGLAQEELSMGYAGLYADTSLEEVRINLADYLDIVEFHVGVIPHSLDAVKARPVAFIHLDLNGAKPTGDALHFFFPMLSAGGIIVFDDYGYQGYEPQRAVIDNFFSDRPEMVLALPTGQGVVVKL